MDMAVELSSDALFKYGSVIVFDMMPKALQIANILSSFSAFKI